MFRRYSSAEAVYAAGSAALLLPFLFLGGLSAANIPAHLLRVLENRLFYYPGEPWTPSPKPSLRC